MHTCSPTPDLSPAWPAERIRNRIILYRGTWVAQSVKRPIWAQVMISRFLSWSPVWGSGLTARSLAPASDSVSPSLSALPPKKRSFLLSSTASSWTRYIPGIFPLGTITRHEFVFLSLWFKGVIYNVSFCKCLTPISFLRTYRDCCQLTNTF